MTNENASTRTMQQHAQLITTTWQKGVRSIIDTGKRLKEAQDELDHGEWERMFDEKKLPFSIRTAQRLMEIADHPVMGNATHVSHLPPHWGTLSELVPLSGQEMLACIADGKIHPEMTREEAKALRPPHQGHGGGETEGDEPATQQSTSHHHQQRSELDPHLAEVVQLGEVLFRDLRNRRRVAAEQLYELADKLKALGDQLSGGVEVAAARQSLK